MAKRNALTPDEKEQIRLHKKYGRTLPKTRQYPSLPGQRVFDFDVAQTREITKSLMATRRSSDDDADAADANRN